MFVAFLAKAQLMFYLLQLKATATVLADPFFELFTFSFTVQIDEKDY
jgi:hypothetical protein